MLVTRPNVFDDTLSRCKKSRTVVLGDIALVLVRPTAEKAATPWLIVKGFQEVFLYFSQRENLEVRPRHPCF